MTTTERPGAGRLSDMLRAAPEAPAAAAGPGPALSNDELRKLKSWLIGRVTSSMDEGSSPLAAGGLRNEVEARLQEAYESTRVALPSTVRAGLLREILNELFGFGPIQPLLEDPGITEIMVNGPRRVYIERDGKLTLTPIQFDDDEHVRRVIDRIILPLGRRIDYDMPLVDARLPDGSRVNAIIPPVAIDGPSLTIRKFSAKKLTVDDLIEFGSLTPQISEFLKACVVTRLNTVVSGGAGAGKTTLLNVLSGFIPDGERIVTIEDSAELRMHQDHIVRLEAKKPDLDGKGEISIRDCVRNALRMRPDRIVVGECRGGEALDMLQAMNTGHDGSLTTLHANSPRDAISRMETLSLMSGVALPLKVIREQIASAVDLIVQQSRMRDGARKITHITEVVGMEGDTVVLQDVFKYVEDGLTSDGHVIGQMRPTGLRPVFTPRLDAAGFKLPSEIYSDGLQRETRTSRR